MKARNMIVFLKGPPPKISSSALNWMQQVNPKPFQGDLCRRLMDTFLTSEKQVSKTLEVGDIAGIPLPGS